jgi:hypothetical protein
VADDPETPVADPATYSATAKALRLRDVPRGPEGTWGNPCLFRGRNADSTSDTDTHVKAFFQNQQLRFVITNLEQYAGDANISRFDVAGGFVPDVAILRDDLLLTIGTRILTGPRATPESPILQQGSTSTTYYPYVYVIDQGRTSSSPAARGQILRLNPRGGSSGLPLFDSNYTSYPFQIQ